MKFSVVAVLALGQLALAAPPAQSTYCYEDNLLRAFQHTPTPASTYCATTSGYPSFLAVATYPPSRLSSACSCFSRFPTEPTPNPCSSATKYELTGYSTTNNYFLDVVVTVDLTRTCGTSGGHVITNVCGTAVGSTLSYVPNDTDLGADNCFPPDNNGFDLTVDSQHIKYNIYALTPGTTHAPYGVKDAQEGYVDSYSNEFAQVSCSAACPSP